MPTYSLGFVFSSDLKQVLLVHKNRPAWQAGKTNGIGGKIEKNESAIECIARECFEEASLEIPLDAWDCFGRITQDPGDVELFVAVYKKDISDATQKDHEKIEWFQYHQLPSNVMSNLHFLIPAARLRLLDLHFEETVLKY